MLVSGGRACETGAASRLRSGDPEEVKCVRGERVRAWGLKGSRERGGRKRTTTRASLAAAAASSSSAAANGSDDSSPSLHARPARASPLSHTHDTQAHPTTSTSPAHPRANYPPQAARCKQAERNRQNSVLFPPCPLFSCSLLLPPLPQAFSPENQATPEKTASLTSRTTVPSARSRTNKMQRQAPLRLVRKRARERRRGTRSVLLPNPGLAATSPAARALAPTRAPLRPRRRARPCPYRVSIDLGVAP
jgi:hypothetical protein